MPLIKNTDSDPIEYLLMQTYREVICLKDEEGFQDVAQRLRSTPLAFPYHIAEGYVAIDKKLDTSDDVPYGSYKHVLAPNSYEKLVVCPIKRNDVYMIPERMEGVLERIDKFFDSAELYAQIPTSHRLGCLIHGPPGNGKTAFIRALAQKYSESAHVIWCNSIPTFQMLSALNAIQSRKIIVIEEIVSMTGAWQNGLTATASDLLTMMDGEQSLENCVVIATTNYPEELKENLTNRPSRFDVVVKMDNPEKDVARKYLSQMLKIREEDVVVEPAGVSYASLKELAIRVKIYGISQHQAYQEILDMQATAKRNFEPEKTFGLAMPMISDYPV